MSAPSFPDTFNMADYFVFSNIEAGRGKKAAILFDGKTISYRAVADNVMRVAKNLVSDGLLPEQRVLLCMQDRPEFAYAWFGAIKAGGVASQINPLLTAEDYEYYLSYVRPQFVFLDEQSLPEFEKALKNTRHCGRSLGLDNVIVAGPHAGGHKSFDTWLQQEPKPGAEPWPKMPCSRRPGRISGRKMANATAASPTRRPDAASCRVSGPRPSSSVVSSQTVTRRPHSRSRCRPSVASMAR